MAQFLKEQPWVRAANGITGEAELIVQIVASKMAAFTKILVDELPALPDVSGTQSLYVWTLFQIGKSAHVKR